MRFSGPVHAGFIAVIALVAISASCSHRHARAKLPTSPISTGTTETGVASWYGVPYHGRQTSSGEIYDMYALTAAHRYLPFQTWVQVENLANGKRVDVRINDRGPFVHDRIIDLSQTAAKQIDMLGPGTARVRLTVIAPPHPLTSYQPAASPSSSATKSSAAAQIARAPIPSPALTPSLAPETAPSSERPLSPIATAPAGVSIVPMPRYAVQAGAFADRDRAEMFRARMADAYADARTRIDSSRSPSLWRVVVGREMTREQADALALRVRTEAGVGVVVPEPDAGLN
jgi:rare lipoprotein A